MEDHRSQKEADSLGSSIDGSGQSTGLTSQVEIQIQAQKVVENISCNLSNGFLRNARKHSISQLLEYCCTDSGGAICSLGSDKSIHWQEQNPN